MKVSTPAVSKKAEILKKSDPMDTERIWQCEAVAIVCRAMTLMGVNLAFILIQSVWAGPATAADSRVWLFPVVAFYYE